MNQYALALGFRASRRQRNRDGLFISALALPPLFGVWLLAHSQLNSEVEVPWHHFVVVTLVSTLALVLALALAVAAVRIAAYRVLFLSLGFVAMAGLFAVHALATPGVLVAASQEYSHRAVVQVSAFLSLAIPSVFFALSYTRLSELLDRRLPFFPSGWLVVGVVAVIGAYGALAIGSAPAVSALPLASPPYSYVSASLSIVLLGSAAWSQMRTYQRQRQPLQGTLAVAFVLLAESQFLMVAAQTWTLAWWSYHFLMLIAVAFALRSLVVERARGKSVRSVLEATLDLEVKVGAELENVQAIAALAAAIEARDPGLQGHNARVAHLAVAIGHELQLPNTALRVLARAGLLHDVGKLAIPDSILQKPGPLTDEEWEVMKKHPELGLDMLASFGELRREKEIILAHHERMDGSGYPRGLKGTDIPLEARIIAIADTYDVVTSDRPYRRGRTAREAKEVLLEEADHHLDRRAVEAALRILGAEHTLSSAMRASADVVPGVRA